MTRDTRPGFMSYTRDSSLRRHHFGPVKPLPASHYGPSWLARVFGRAG